MIRSGRIVLVAAMMTLLSIGGLASAKTDEMRLGIFEGITPCSAADKPAPQIPADSDCEMMSWKLTLYQRTETGEPASYQLRVAYGVSQPNTPGMQGGGTPLNLEGYWAVLHGTKANPDALVYQLNPEDPRAAISFLKVDDNLLHVLAPDATLLVGNGGWSYTLNRADPVPVSDPTQLNVTVAQVPPAALLPDLATSGTFEGRTPCLESIMTLYEIANPQACNHVKWQLTLHRDADTGLPTTYELGNVGVGTSDNRHTNTGEWSIVQGIPTDPEAVVYQLHASSLPEPLSFLRVDEGNLFLLAPDFTPLVGDALLSYTLSRVA